jgi:trk system potassium uptake protein
VRSGPALNWQIIVPVVSGALLATGVGLAACFVVAIVSGEGSPAAFGAPAAVTIPLALIGLTRGRRLRSLPLRPRDGYFAVTMAWIGAAAVGAVPFLLEGTFERAADAFFESMSGFTTTGATLLDEVEPEPDAILLWRSLTQWLGGVGIVVLVVAVAPATGLATQRVFYAETSGITQDRVTPRIAETAKVIWGVYLALTLAGFAAYWIAGMTPWEAVNHIFTTIATGGFSTRTASIGGFDSLPIELVAIAFMVAGGVNFTFYWVAVTGRGRIWPQAAEVRAYLLILAGAVAGVTAALELGDPTKDFAPALRAASFTVVSITTTTGYTTDDFDEWADFARLSILALMFVGGCAGSTAGGMKVIRIMLLAKAAAQEVQRSLRPAAVQVLRTRGRVFSEAVRRGVLAFALLYALVFFLGTLAMEAAGLDLPTATSSVAATLNVVGPGLGEVGAAENFAVVPEGGRWVLSALMLIGRLEVFTVVALLSPAFWRHPRT